MEIVRILDATNAGVCLGWGLHGEQIVAQGDYRQEQQHCHAQREQLRAPRQGRGDAVRQPESHKGKRAHCPRNVEKNLHRLTRFYPKEGKTQLL